MQHENGEGRKEKDWGKDGRKRKGKGMETKEEHERKCEKQK